LKNKGAKMGLIREIQGVNATINKQERARRERERLKILTENYKKELESDLKAEFLNIYNKTDFDTAYKIIVLQKDDIIQKLYNIISKITYTENGKRYLTYFNFDIVEDLEKAYYKILAKVKNEFTLIANINKKDLLTQLENKLTRLFELSNNKYCASIVMKKNETKIKIINDMAQNERDKNTLKDNYSRVLAKVIKQYDGDIITEKMENKSKKEKARIKQNKKIFNQIIWGHILGDISKSLPKGFSRGKRR
jgi:hypothetical protein